jgi:hypothetical protein
MGLAVSAPIGVGGHAGAVDLIVQDPFQQADIPDHPHHHRLTEICIQILGQ